MAAVVKRWMERRMDDGRRTTMVRFARVRDSERAAAARYRQGPRDARNCTAAARRFPASLLPSSSLESRSDQPQTVLRLPVPASHAAFSALQRLDEQPGRW